jgi:hypothetical protein
MSLANQDSLIKAKPEIALTEIRGIFPTDLVIQKAIEIGLKDLRDNPNQLNYVFAWLLFDDQTADNYGQKERDNAINWFLKTNIPVLSDIRLDADTFPSISYSLMSDEQVNETLADLNYETTQSIPAAWEPLTPKFSPSYDPATGLVTLTSFVYNLIPITTDLLLVSGQGKVYQIIEVTDSGFFIEPNLTVNLRDSVLKNKRGRLTTGVESCQFKQVIRIGCHSVGDPRHALYLHSIVKYCLLRYRRTLLEGRGFEQSTISSGPISRNESVPVENLFTRYITLIGHVRDFWASVQAERVLETSTRVIPGYGAGVKISPIGTDTDSMTKFITEPDLDDPAWLAMDVTGAVSR